MPIKILMPALSPTMTEGNLVKWYKKQGDLVKAGDLLAEIETDKATMEVEAVDEGILAKILVTAGTENVAVNQVIAILLEEGEDASLIGEDQQFAVAEDNSKTVVQNLAPSVSPDLAKTQINNSKVVDVSPERPIGRPIITPLAKRIARENNLTVEQMRGSGPNGRIIKADVEYFVQNIPNTALVESPNSINYQDIKLTAMRKTVARRLTESKQTIPHFYLNIECDLDSLLLLRKQLNDCFINSADLSIPNLSGAKLSVNDFIIKAIALALIKVPEANVTWHDSYLRHYQQADVAVAVALDGGLVTPIIKAAEKKSLVSISKEIKDLASLARLGKLKPEDYQGGSFTVSNLGMYGVQSFAAIINPPQACILAVGAGEQRAVVKGGDISVATVMTCTLSVDHRAVDGAVGAKLLREFKMLIENPLLLVV